MRSFLKNKGGNVDRLNESLITIMQYSDNEYKFPELDNITPELGIDPNLIYPIFKSDKVFAETSAINLYITSGEQFDDYDDLFTGIAMVEMLHLDKLGDLISHIGGNVVRSYSTENIKYGRTPQEALQIAIDDEKRTIEEYNIIFDNIVRNTSGTGKETAIQFFNKIIADEKFHIELFTEKLSML